MGRAAGLALNADVSPITDVGPPLVLVHGVAGSLRIWDPVFDRLAALRTTVRFDLLGYGHSPKPRLTYTPSRHARAIRETLRGLSIKPPYILVGLSMGSTVVLQYAADYPDEVASLMMIGYPYYASRTRAEQGLRHNLWAGLTIDHPLVARVFIPAAWTLGRLRILPPRLFAGIYSPVQARETLLSPYRVFRSNIWDSMVDVDHDVLLRASAGKPRLFLHGSRDEWSPADEVRRAVSGPDGTRFREVPDAGHNLVVLEPDTVVTHVRRVLEK